jgi:hypothetical protein
VKYLLDGYNLAHWLLRDDELSPDQLRAGLMSVLRQSLPADATEVHVYWDVRRPSPLIRPNEYLGWCTVHNVPDADEAIIEAVYSDPTPRRLRVVSRDREVAGRSRQLGARIVSPDRFLGR